MGDANTFIGKPAVLEGLPGHPAVKAILAWNPEALTDAKFDRNELTLTIAAEQIRAAAASAILRSKKIASPLASCLARYIAPSALRRKVS